MRGPQGAVYVYYDWYLKKVPSGTEKPSTQLRGGKTPLVTFRANPRAPLVSNVWPSSQYVSLPFRLDFHARSYAKSVFMDVYAFATEQYQDCSAQPDPDPDNPPAPSKIGDGCNILHPDYPVAAPGTKNGREAHDKHLHMQIGE
jgi:hypothetical protein